MQIAINRMQTEKEILQKRQKEARLSQQFKITWHLSGCD